MREKVSYRKGELVRLFARRPKGLSVQKAGLDMLAP